MPDIASVLKAEIARVARKEIRAETGQLRTASVLYRHQIAVLRRKIEGLERELRRLGRKGDRKSAAAEASGAGDGAKQLRFSASRLAAQRKRLGLSAREMGTLIGVSPLTVYKWEKGESRPRVQQLQAISQVRSLGKREAAARLEAISAMN